MPQFGINIQLPETRLASPRRSRILPGNGRHSCRPIRRIVLLSFRIQLINCYFCESPSETEGSLGGASTVLSPPGGHALAS
jgi:hypothetical protein